MQATRTAPVTMITRGLTISVLRSVEEEEVMLGFAEVAHTTKSLKRRWHVLMNTERGISMTIASRASLKWPLIRTASLFLLHKSLKQDIFNPIKMSLSPALVALV